MLQKYTFLSKLQVSEGKEWINLGKNILLSLFIDRLKISYDYCNKPFWAILKKATLSLQIFAKKVYILCTNLCTISWLNFYGVQWSTLLKVYNAFSTAPFLFSRSSRTPLGAPWRCRTPWSGGPVSWLCHSAWVRALHRCARVWSQIPKSTHWLTVCLQIEKKVRLQKSEQ